MNVDLVYLREILAFSRRMLGLPILMMLFLQIDTFVIGKLLSLQVLGMYYLARDLADLPNKLINRIGPIFLPTLSIIQDDASNLNKSILTFTRGMTTFGVPFAAFFILFSKSLLSTAFGPEYSHLSTPFSILCVNCLILIASQFIMNVYIAIGKPHIHRRSSLVRTLSFLILIYPATRTFGLLGASLSVLLAMVLSLSIQLFYLRTLLGFGLFKYLQEWIPGISLALIIIIPWAGLCLTGLDNSNLHIVIGSLLCLFAWTIGILVLTRAWIENIDSFAQHF